MGFGLALFFLPLNQIIMAGVSQSELASAAGLSNFVRTLSGSIVDGHLRLLLERALRGPLRAGSSSTSAPDSAGWADYQAQPRAAGHHRRRALAYVSQMIQLQASTLGANDLFLGMAMLFIALIPVVWLARPPFRTIGMGGAH